MQPASLTRGLALVALVAGVAGRATPSGRGVLRGADGQSPGHAAAVHLARAANLAKQRAARARNGEPITCGHAPTYPNAKPKNYEDQRKTKYDPELKEEVEVTFAAGESIEFECEKGYTTDGAQEGETTFMVDCAEQGYYKPQGVCQEVSKCGKAPVIEHAGATGDKDGKKVQYACKDGYSLDGEKVIAGGFGKNKFFSIECQEFSGQWTKFKGECQPYAFAPTSVVISMYNQVFEALFTVSCKSTLKHHFAASGEPPSGLDGACAKMEESQGDCSSLVSEIKSDFESKAKELEAHKEENKKEWYEDDPSAPNINDEAQEFCEKLWKLLELPSL